MTRLRAAVDGNVETVTGFLLAAGAEQVGAVLERTALLDAAHSMRVLGPPTAPMGEPPPEHRRWCPLVAQRLLARHCRFPQHPPAKMPGEDRYSHPVASTGAAAAGWAASSIPSGSAGPASRLPAWPAGGTTPPAVTARVRPSGSPSQCA